MKHNLYKSIDEIHQEVCIVEPKAIFKVIDKEKDDLANVIKDENDTDVFVYLHI